ncbi:hypothetical protein EJB05_13678 [Eragrostis curvula]|uniref:Uncharacterized protein n=1 Tax=Eragrostis curvula TaxID=38414 RepID=A0A5J9VX76_9POAL|nr:hypothetical protein EJB05_13678 [Eragrostis curvula]
MKTKAAAAASNKVAVDEDEDEPKKIRSSRSKRRHTRSSSIESESPPRKRSKKSSKRIADKKSKRSKVSSSSSRRRRRSPSPSPSLSSSSPSSLSRSYSRRSCSTCSSASERSVSPPPRSRSRDVKKRKVRGRDRERDRKRRKARRSTSCSSSSDSSRSRSKSRKRGVKDGTTKDRTEKEYGNGHASRSEKNLTDDVCRDENALVIAKEGDNGIEGYEKNVSLDKIENPPSKDTDETTDVLPAGGGSPVPVAEDLELILRQKALENFRKFRAAAAKTRKTDNGATEKETLTGSPHNDGTKAAEARSAAVAPLQRHPSRVGVKHPTESPRSENCGNGASRSWKQESSAGMSHRIRSPRILEDGDTGCPTEQEGRTIEATHSTFQSRSPQDDRNTRAVMQRLVSTPGSSSSVNQRLGSSAGVSHVNGAPRIRSVVSIPAREGPDDSSYTTPHRHCGSSAPGEINSEIEPNLTDVNRTEIGHTNGDDRKTNEASASNGGSILSPDEGKSQATEARVEDKDGSQFQKKTFSRMHDGETVEVSYKVYIPKKTPALARRKLQR